MEKTNEPSKLKKIFSLFWVFFKIGAFTFGGGYAMIPIIQREVVESRPWITDDDILEIIAIAESTPGPIAINSATFVGYRVAGFFGAMFATLGVVLPSFIIILVISYLLKGFEHIRAVKYAFWGIRAGVMALLVKAWWGMFRKCPKGVISYAIAAFSFVAAVLAAQLNISVIYVLICCALIGLISSVIIKRRALK